MTNAKIWILICIGIGYSVTYILSDCQCKAERGEANNNKCSKLDGHILKGISFKCFDKYFFFQI